ncbi:hypothetical protein [Flagellimonas allohymeniacidonis]|uniref:DUF3108 domain-containing protein n=1 Tax=Flagellimonas allohymeniacidonis TaxID=2517819 RepID=A0A4Q8QCK7_9FLAO|nr:hypothetical protein [Allomuricauda hymeniacidonis]TAI48152.1 hypothetical protein EW142_16030 [Allomuricauda hymeniacidonis]
MKYLIVLLLIILPFTGQHTNAQGKCSKYYPMTEGSFVTLTMYDVDDVSQGKVTYKVDKVVGDTGEYTYTMESRGMVLSSSQYNVECTDDGVEIDFKSMAGGMLARYSDMEADIQGSNIYLPNDLADYLATSGPLLPESSMELVVTTPAGTQRISMKMTNRTIEGTETLNGPNGEEFDCHIVSYDMIMNMGTTIASHTKQWLAEGVGVVKMLDYAEDKTTLRGSMLLTDYNVN